MGLTVGDTVVSPVARHHTSRIDVGYDRRRCAGIDDGGVGAILQRKPCCIAIAVVPRTHNLPTVVDPERLGLRGGGEIDGREMIRGREQESVGKAGSVQVVAHRLVQIVYPVEKCPSRAGIIKLLESRIGETAKTMIYGTAVNISAHNNPGLVDAECRCRRRPWIIERCEVKRDLRLHAPAECQNYYCRNHRDIKSMFDRIAEGSHTNIPFWILLTCGCSETGIH